jgi:DNA (cytosine-5)-methyltransferase 1
MNVLSLFSGVGGMDLGLERAGHTIVAMCEIDKHARSILAHHWPDVPIHEDVTTLDGRQYAGRIDLVAGGSPCQDLSVAGQRKGLDGARSGLFWHQCRVADQAAARWVLWENVPGVLSSNNGHDFAAVLWGLTGSYPRVPDGGWNTCGVVVGPKRWCVWRLLDAQWFGVAQRRRRVFVVAGAGTPCRPEILFESEGMFGGVAPSRTPREEVAGTLGGGSGSRGWAPDTDRMTFVPVVFGMSQHAGYTEGVTTLTATDHKRPEQNIVTDTVRRLTPIECERLMGWPDNWTHTRHDGKQQADSHRYQQIGNGVVANVAQWIGNRLH